MDTKTIVHANKKILKKVGIANPELKEITSLGEKELDYRSPRPLFASKGLLYCTRCNETIEDTPTRHACPCCGQMYTD